VQVTRWLRVAQPVLGLGLVQRLLKRRVDTRVGPDASRRASSRCHVWGEARNAAGDTATLELDTPNGYTLTASAALGIVEQLLADARPAGGYYTPSQLMGARYVLGLPGVTCRKPP
jgi:short subunit dehydrogenase-like uncharacterized protein